ncbi:MAG: AraC family transcriptional regulator [Lachnospiraceae bacterium]|nr:AraC family transcriptional regulator [Lachnospiraceae bacterium]
MSDAYLKKVFDDDPDYNLHYTFESHPRQSTSPHLHYDTTLVLTYFLKGSGCFLVEGQQYLVGPGDLLLLNQSELHVMTVDDSEHERISLYIYDSIFDKWNCPRHHFFDAFNSRINGSNNVIPAETVARSGLGRQIQKILEYKSRRTPEGSVLAGCAVIEMLDMLNNVSVPSAGDSSVRSISNKHINDIIHYLSENYAQKIEIDELAYRFHFNKHYLCRLFKECTGTSIVEYCTLKKILYFNRLVCQNLSLENAAYKAGFQNYSNFYRLYKKYTGISPSEYRQKIRGADDSTGI